MYVHISINEYSLLYLSGAYSPFFLSSPQPCSEEEIENVAYAGRQLNSTCATVQFFKMAVLCNLNQQQQLNALMSRCYDSVEVAYVYNKCTPLSKF